MERNDRVFQLSLTEIAFVLIFILLLLLGWMVFGAERDKRELIAKAEKIGDAQALVSAANRAKQELDGMLREAKLPNPDVVISQLVERQKLEQQRDSLRARVKELDEAVSSLTAVKMEIQAEAAKGNASDAVKTVVADAVALSSSIRQILKNTKPSGGQGTESSHDVSQQEAVAEARSAIALKRELEVGLRKELGHGVQAGREAEVAANLISAAKALMTKNGAAPSPHEIAKENKDLRGQVAFLKGRLEARGGRDFPPCWADEGTGKLQYLFTIQIRSDGLLVSPAWPESREADAKGLPGLGSLLTESPLSGAQFSEAMQGIDRDSKAKNCRHYVFLRNQVKDLDVFNRYRFAVENYFYKFETR